MSSLFPSIFGKNDVQAALQARLDNMFDDMGKGPMAAWTDLAINQQVIPAIDVKETDKAIEIKAEIPDMDEKDIKVDVVGNYLSINGEKKQQSEKDEEGYHIQERSFGAFHRRIPLGFSLDADKIEAQYEKGVLSILVPKPEEVQLQNNHVKVKFHN